MIAARRAKALAIRAASGAKRCMRDSPLNGLSTRQHPSQFEAANAPASLGVQYGSRACGCSRRAGPAGARIRALRPPREPGAMRLAPIAPPPIPTAADKLPVAKLKATRLQGRGLRGADQCEPANAFLTLQKKSAAMFCVHFFAPRSGFGVSCFSSRTSSGKLSATYITAAVTSPTVIPSHQ